MNMKKKLLCYSLILALLFTSNSFVFGESLNSNFSANVSTASNEGTDIFSYTVSEDGVTITGLNDVPSNGLIIPDLIEGLPVVAIGDKAFYGMHTIKGALVLPATLTSIGTSAFAYCSGLSGELILPESLKSIGNLAFNSCNSLSGELVIPENVEQIGASAFTYCEGLTKVSIPKTVSSIGSSAFQRCISLSEISVDENNEKYCDLEGVLFNKNATTLHSFPGNKTGQYTVPSSVTKIDSTAFDYCGGLTGVIIPSSVSSMGSTPFINCPTLLNIDVDDANENYCDQDGILFDKGKTTLIAFPDARTGEYTIPDTVTIISMNNFEGSKLTSLYFPATMEQLRLASMKNPNTITNYYVADENTAYADIDGVLFSKDKKELIAFPPGRTGEYTVNNSIEKINKDAFHNSKLTSIAFTSNCYISDISGLLNAAGTSIANYDVEDGNFKYSAVDGVLFSGAMSKLIAFPKTREGSYHVPDGVDAIGADAFTYCDGITELVLSDTVTKLEDYAVYDCLNLSTVKLSDNLSSIGNENFYHCQSLKSITLPKSLTQMGYWAFADCYTLSTINCESTNLVIGGDCFQNAQLLTIYGHEDSTIQAYAAESLIPFVSESHQWYNGTIEKAATCTENGVMRFTCDICDKEELAVLTASHQWDDDYTIDREPTCKMRGSKSIHCQKCDEVKSVTSIPLTDHKIVTIQRDPAAIGETGKTEGKKCSVCGTITVKQSMIAAIETVKLSYTKKSYTGSTIVAPELTITDTDAKDLIKGTDYTVTGLSGKKSVGRYKVSITFKNNYEGSKDLYFTIVPKAPSKVTAELYGYDDVKISWSKSTGASGYNVYYKKSGADEYTYLTRTTGTSVEKSNLLDGKKYYFKVVPYYKNGTTRYTSLSSKTDNVYTLKKISTPTASRNGSKVKVKWTNISGETGYQISQSTKKTGTNIVTTYKTTTGTYKNISAVKGKTYYYKVRAYKKVTIDGKTSTIYGPWSKVKSFKR